MIYTSVRCSGACTSLKGEECFTDGVTWTNEFVQDITPSITTIFDCLDLCKKTADCKAFSWINKEHPLFPESCLTYTNSSQPVTCEECVSGRLADCQLCSHSVSCQIWENMISAVPTTTEVECQYVCARTADCKYYTWFNGSAVPKNICFLLSSCGETEDCTSCSSGPSSCQEDHCEGIDYKILDDPTRNEKHGK